MKQDYLALGLDKHYCIFFCNAIKLNPDFYAISIYVFMYYVFNYYLLFLVIVLYKLL